MTKNFAVIDLGTNAYKLSIQDIDRNLLHKEYKESKRDILGRNIDADYLIECLKTFNSALREEGLNLRDKKVRVIAAENFRNADNSDEVLKKIKEEIKVDINIIDKRREANLGIKGALLHAKDTEGKNIINIDIGGGSTQLSFYSHEEKEIVQQYSIPMGSRMLVNDYFISNPADRKFLIRKNQDYLKSEVEEFKYGFDFYRYDMDDVLILMNSSSFLRTASKALKYEKYMPDQVVGHEFEVGNVISELDRISKTSPHKVIEELNISKPLAPQIVTSAFIAKTILESLETDRSQPIQATIYGVKEGLISEMIIEDEKSSKSFDYNNIAYQDAKIR